MHTNSITDMGFLLVRQLQFGGGGCARLKKRMFVLMWVAYLVGRGRLLYSIRVVVCFEKLELQWHSVIFRGAIVQLSSLCCTVFKSEWFFLAEISNGFFWLKKSEWFFLDHPVIETSIY